MRENRTYGLRRGLRDSILSPVLYSTLLSGDVVGESPTGDVTKSLQGRLPGLKINDRGGEPGTSNTEILIRGKSTLGNNAPLIVIDGVPRSKDDFSNLSSEDIEDIR